MVNVKTINMYRPNFNAGTYLDSILNKQFFLNNENGSFFIKFYT